MSSRVERLWYQRKRPLWPLWPLAWLYRAIAGRRRRQFLSHPPDSLPLPVLVVGNITAGGTGKSPLTASLVTHLREQGWRPVIITRGYGGRSDHYPLEVGSHTPVEETGDEPLMLSRMTGCPVVVDPDRQQAARYAIARDLGNILVCDDGLQHYRLPRDLEIAVIDGARCLGNGAPIPVGPLREPPERLSEVDLVVINGDTEACSGLPVVSDHCFAMELLPCALRRLDSGEIVPLSELKGCRVRAVAGIGNPGRFFRTLAELGANVQPRALSDHHRFRREDFAVAGDETLVITAKDAVKCRDIAPGGTLVLEVRAQLQTGFTDLLDRKLANIASRKGSRS
ncbi:tetraacyldisaccharide 4'-kinase [Marinobacter sp.]|uniref:tetraacyldisaccharide 4'-kinase n=1 Tax=Marinobacter sp. TaxID=50741 RepID=UPI0019C1CF5A|nr:tetraacyldisaccharide 4'-kinase [Marinobacter sp.]MBC7192103.1 tetraacyldisaccharide 4'-kinase [Marinobacter sp.]